MKHKLIVLVIALFCAANTFGQLKYQTAKPWTYWWWMGSAVNRADIKKQLTEFERAGLGGVHIVPIYGVKGLEGQFRDFLSEEWLEVVQNLSSNYMKKFDKENPGWKKFYDINFVNITYDPFSTSKWDYEPSGIMGEVQLSIAE